MKKVVLLSLLLALGTWCFAQPTIQNLTYCSTANVFGLHEISFELGPYDNPYDPEVIDVYAVFFGPENQEIQVNGFYYEDYTFIDKNRLEKTRLNTRNNGWRIRFTPDQPGSWTFVIHAIDATGVCVLADIDGERFHFVCHETAHAEGFISKANSRYLRREVIKDGQRQYHSFFPIGPNVAWYDCYPYFDYASPFGIYDYQRYTDSLAGKANYMRVWLNRYQYLSLFGPEYTQTVNGKPVVYFDNTINQKDAAEFDHILEYAARHDIAVMPCLFTYGDFQTAANYSDQNPSEWRNNPFHTQLGLESPCEFLTDPKAKRITKNLLRYCAARWGYATNIVSWELWNEINNMTNNLLPSEQYQQQAVRWHEEMSEYLREQDPFHHLISTSIVDNRGLTTLENKVYQSLDFCQAHNYQNIHKAMSKSQFSHILLQLSERKLELYPDKPFFVGEFAFGQDSPQKRYVDHDPKGIDLHNSLWSSLFSGAMGPASFWYWDVLKACGLFGRTQPLYRFCEKLPILSDSFKAAHTGYVSGNALVFPNDLETYYLINAAEDTVYGWSQDTAFCYQSLRYLAGHTASNGHFDDQVQKNDYDYLYTLDPAMRPRPSSRSNTISLPIESQPLGTEYEIHWYDSETGWELVGERSTARVTQDRRKNLQLSFEFPSSIRDLRRKTVNNTFGDAVFVIYKKYQ